MTWLEVALTGLKSLARLLSQKNAPSSTPKDESAARTGQAAGASASFEGKLAAERARASRQR